MDKIYINGHFKKYKWHLSRDHEGGQPWDKVSTLWTAEKKVGDMGHQPRHRVITLTSTRAAYFQASK